MFLVLTIAFLLSKNVPGDAASSMMILQGISAESKDTKKEYQRQYKALGLDKPLFYFSIQPDFYPKNINAICDETERDQTTAFLIQKVDHLFIKDYLSKREIFLSKLAKDSLYSHQDSLFITPKLAFETEITALETLLYKIPVPEPTESFNALQHLKTSFNNTKNGKVDFYLPQLRWYGTDNQFHKWISNILKGNFGISIKDGRMVSEKILSALNWTLVLILLNILVTGIIAIPAGLYAGYKENSYFDMITSFLWLLLYSIPVFWLASLMIVYFTSARFGAMMNIFPTPGTWFVPEGHHLLNIIKDYAGQLVLPVICLAANDIAQLSRIVRNNVINQKSSLYVKFALSKGLSSFQTLFRHILPNVLIPLITVVGGRIPAGLSGALVIEVIFNIPGMGRLMFDSIFSTDWNVVFGILIVISFFTIFFILLTDILYAVFSPGAKKSLG